MRATEFLAAYAGKGPGTWEKAAVDLAARGDVPKLAFTTLNLSSPGHTATLDVSNDYFQVGTADDSLRLPLLPKTAQTIANIYGYLLPTPKLVLEMWKQSSAKQTPITAYQLGQTNAGANLTQYALHNAAINAALTTHDPSAMLTGVKKDIVISKLLRPGKVIIYGWFWPDARPMNESYAAMVAGTSQPIQPRSDAHGDFYVDYSHGVRFVSPLMTVDGKSVRTEDVLTDAAGAGLNALVSDEGPLRPDQVRYPASNSPRPASKPAMVSMLDAEAGLAEIGLVELARRKL